VAKTLHGQLFDLPENDSSDCDRDVMGWAFTWLVMLCLPLPGLSHVLILKFDPRGEASLLHVLNHVFGGRCAARRDCGGVIIIARTGKPRGTCGGTAHGGRCGRS
jgi:hypothetical protein